MTELNPATPDPAGPLLSQLAALRDQGAQRLDPTRFYFLERLAQRLSEAKGGVRPVLEGKLQAALQRYVERYQQAQQTANDTLQQLVARYPEKARELRRHRATGDFQHLCRVVASLGAPPKGRALASLTQLNQYIQHAAQGLGNENLGSRLGSEGAARADLKSVGRFREAWSLTAAQDQVAQAVVRGPENAGPMNSHMLVLRSLALMRELSPDYLRRFLAQVDSLQWLEQVNQKHELVDARPPRRARRKR